MTDELDILFQNAYRDNITARDDFKELPNTTKMQMKKKMKQLFIQIFKQFGTTNTDYEMFYYLFNKALTELQLEGAIQNSQPLDDFSSGGMKRPH